MLLTAPAIRAQECFAPVLLPVHASQVPGANESLWQTFLTLTNHGESGVRIGGIGSCRTGLCETPVLAPKATVTPRVHGDYVWIDCAGVHDVEISLRVRDLSRALDTWGTAIPVVHERDAFRGEVVSITDVPNSFRFRSMLRIYGVPEGSSGPAVVDIYEILGTEEAGDAPADRLLTSLSVALAPSALDPHHTPGLAQVPLWTLPELEGIGRLRVEVRGPSELGMWAMVSATNNDTQHVTILSPRRPAGE